MMSNDHSIVYLSSKKLLFFPSGIEIEIGDDEIEAWNILEEYSVLEFNNQAAYVYYDASSIDNALFITNKCNSNCIMCPTSDIVRRDSGVEKIENLMQICKQIPSDAVHLTITGGEPFLLGEDIFTMLSYLKRSLNEVEYLLLTNGRVFSNNSFFEKFKATFPRKMTVAIPIHGSTKEKHDNIVRSSGAFNQTIAGLQKLTQLDLKLEIRIVVSKLNIEDIDNIADLIIEQIPNVSVVNIIGLEMLGNARKNMTEVWIDYKESFKKIRNTIRRLVVSGIDVGVYNYPLCCVDRAFWPICEKSITEYKVKYLEECEKCAKKDACGGMFSGTFRLMEGVVKAIL